MLNIWALNFINSVWLQLLYSQSKTVMIAIKYLHYGLQIMLVHVILNSFNSCWINTDITKHSCLSLGLLLWTLWKTKGNLQTSFIILNKPPQSYCVLLNVMITEWITQFPQLLIFKDLWWAVWAFKAFSAGLKNIRVTGCHKFFY